MKSLYRCDCCGKLSEDYDEIAMCERKHYRVCRGWTGIDGLNEKLENATEYKEGIEEPTVIHVAMQRAYWDGEGNYKEETRCGKYKLISSYVMPLEITDD